MILRIFPTKWINWMFDLFPQRHDRSEAKNLLRRMTVERQTRRKDLTRRSIPSEITESGVSQLRVSRIHSEISSNRLTKTDCQVETHSNSLTIKTRLSKGLSSSVSTNDRLSLTPSSLTENSSRDSPDSLEKVWTEISIILSGSANLTAMEMIWERTFSTLEGLLTEIDFLSLSNFGSI